MKVKDLIHELSKLSPDHNIFVEGYEGGYSDIIISNIKKITLNINQQDYMGPHDEEEESVVSATILLRKANSYNE